VATQPCISCWNNHVGNLFKMAFLTYSPLLKHINNIPADGYEKCIFMYIHTLLMTIWLKSSLNCSTLLIYHDLLPFTDMSCHGRSEETASWVTCEWPYASASENCDCKNIKMLQNCFAWNKQYNWPKHIFIISYIFMT
jgi:hypothetical protein